MGRRGAAKPERQIWEVFQEVNVIDFEKRKEVFSKFLDSDDYDKYKDKLDNLDLVKKDFKDYKIGDGDNKIPLLEKVIISDGTMSRYMSAARTMANWIKDSYFTESRFQLNMITTDMLVNFLETKRDVDGVKPSTLKVYRSAIYKMQAGLEAKGWYRKDSINLSVIKEFETGERIPKDRQLTNGQIGTMLDYVEQNREDLLGKGPKFLDFGAAMLIQSQGMRVQEMVDIRSSNILLDFEGTVHTEKWGDLNLPRGDYIYIQPNQAKGGLARYVKIDSQYRYILEELKEKDGRVFRGMTADSYREFMERTTNDLFGRSVGCTHELRKYWASSQFMERKELHEMETGRPLTKGECMSICADIVAKLGHGSKGRKDLYKTYIFSALGWS